MKRLLALVLALAMVLGVAMIAASCDDPATPTTTSSSKKPDSSSSSSSTGGNDGTTASTGGNDGTTASTGGNDGTTASTAGGNDDTTASTDGGDDPITGDWDPKTEKLQGYENVTFGGAIFTIAGYKDASDGYDTEREVYSTDTDSIAVAANERTLIVEALYDCDINFVGAEDPNTYITAATTGGDPVHLACVKYTHGTAATGGSRYNLATYLDLDQAWWNQAYVDGISFTDNSGVKSLYGITGDFNLNSYTSTVVLMFNRSLFEQNVGSAKLAEMYELARTGKFTMDNLAEYLATGGRDNGGNGVYSTAEGDIVGWLEASSVKAFGLTKATGLRIVGKTNDKYTLTASNEAAQWTSLIDKAREILALPQYESLSYSDAETEMASGKAIFYSEVLGHAESDAFKNSDIELSIVPFPKYSESQENYSHLVENHAMTYSIPTSNANVDEIADFFTVYAAHTTGIVRPAWLDAYSYEYFSGSESREMLEIVLDSRDFDPGYHVFGGWFAIFYAQATGAQNQIAAMIQRWAPQWNNQITDFYTSVEKNNNK